MNKFIKAQTIITKNFGLVICALFLSSCYSGPSGRPQNAPKLTTVSSVDLNSYLGKWYEIARYPNGFERGCENVTAEYSLANDGSVNVKNSCYVKGNLKVANGRAQIIDGSNGARLAVNFAPIPLPKGQGNYHILFIGNNYQTALVGEPSGKFLWMLARTPQLSAEARQELDNAATNQNYNLNLLENVKQN